MDVNTSGGRVMSDKMRVQIVRIFIIHARVHSHVVVNRSKNCMRNLYVII